MSPDATPDLPAAWPPLDLRERRVLGVLVEKAKTTPDAYPLSLNALVTGCNQKSNRDPVLDLTDLDVEEALASAQKKGLAIKITGGRVVRWRHNLYEAWKVDKVELALLGELLLRGPQTEGELRSRASRMEPIDELEALRAVLRSLRDRGLVAYLTPENRRGTVVTHGFHAAGELERLRHRHAEGAEPEPAAPPSRGPVPDDPSAAEVRAEVEALRRAVSELQGRVDGLEGQVRSLREALGG